MFDKLEFPEKTTTRWIRTLTTIVSVSGASAAIITSIKHGTIVAVSENKDAQFFSENTVSIDDLYCRLVIDSDQELFIKDGKNYSHLPVYKAGYISFFGFPLHLSSSKIFGTLSIYSKIQLNINKQTEKIINEFRYLIESQLKLITESIDRVAELEKQVELAKEAAAEANRLKTAFLANMSHEIRTPMNAIIGFSDLLKVSSLTREQRDRFISIINNNGNLLLNLIDDIIDVAKIEAGQIKVAKSECYINRILSELFDFYQNDKSLKGFNDSKLQLIIPLEQHDNFSVLSDPLRLRQIFSNLINNAFKFTDKGIIKFGYRITDTKESDTKSTYIEFFVKDTGVGISDERKEIIFERFGQIESKYNKNLRGTGLGLPISKKLVELMGGTMWVKSIPNEGSTFYFTIPYLIADAESIIGEVDDKPFSPQSYKWYDKIFLIAEDEDANCMFFQEALYKTKVQILWAKNGKEAVEVFRSNTNIDLVLMDIKMPVMDGYEATEHIKYIDERVPVIAQTAYAMADDKELSYRAGCNGFISKPIKAKELLAYISKFL